MADHFGRVDPVSPHFLNRGAREEPYQGRHAKKHHGHEPASAEPDMEEVVEEEAADSEPKSHIDLRI